MSAKDTNVTVTVDTEAINSSNTNNDSFIIFNASRRQS